jgi:hypothetical protein
MIIRGSELNTYIFKLTSTTDGPRKQQLGTLYIFSMYLDVVQFTFSHCSDLGRLKFSL